MEKFTASNGVEILESGFDREERPVMSLMCREREDVIMSERQFPAHHWDALREFFRHERDEELGRWRWPENPGYVVYPDGTSRRVVRESTGQTMQVSLHDRKAMTTYLDSYVGAAKAYDAAHEPPKPWHDAKPGEVWALLLDGRTDELACWVTQGGPDFEPIYGDDPYATIARGSQRITAARRIWPEASNA